VFRSVLNVLSKHTKVLKIVIEFPHSFVDEWLIMLNVKNQNKISKLSFLLKTTACHTVMFTCTINIDTNYNIVYDTVITTIIAKIM